MKPIEFTEKLEKAKKKKDEFDTKLIIMEDREKELKKELVSLGIKETDDLEVVKEKIVVKLKKIETILDEADNELNGINNGGTLDVD